MTRQLGSRYVLEVPLGRGATGEVWRGADAGGQPLAFKVLHESLAGDPATVQRFLRERAILTGLDHPNLVRVRDLVAEGTTLAIVMDLVEGGDLRAVLATHRVLPPGEACRIGAEVAAGLAAVHAAGVVHRDIKPENVLLDARVSPPASKLTDFGIAKIAEQSGTGRSTMLVGTPRYLAPEVFEGQPPTPAADLYGLGILLYEMCCGVAPFAGDTTLAVLRRHVDHAPGRPAGVPDPLWDVIWQLLAKDPATRLGPAGRVSNVLAALAHDLAGAPPAPPLTEPPPSAPLAVHSQRRGWRWPATSGPPTGAAEAEIDPSTAPATSAAPSAPATPTASSAPGRNPVDALPPPPSDPGVPYESGTLTANDYNLNIDFDNGESRHNDGGPSWRAGQGTNRRCRASATRCRTGTGCCSCHRTASGSTTPSASSPVRVATATSRSGTARSPRRVTCDG